MPDIKRKFYSFLIICIPARTYYFTKRHRFGTSIYSFCLCALPRRAFGQCTYHQLNRSIVLFLLALLVDKFLIIGVLAGITSILLFYIRKRFREIATLTGIFVITAGSVYMVDYVINENVLESDQKERIAVLIGKDYRYENRVNREPVEWRSGCRSIYQQTDFTRNQNQIVFVPGRCTDFIFCTLGEERGFAGTAIVVILYVVLFLQGYQVS